MHRQTTGNKVSHIQNFRNVLSTSKKYLFSSMLAVFLGVVVSREDLLFEDLLDISEQIK